MGGGGLPCFTTLYGEERFISPGETQIYQINYDQ
jgi:hypothetical protein